MKGEAAVVAVHGVTVGTLSRLNEAQDYLFRFDQGWIGMPEAPVLGQTFEDRKPQSIPSSGLPCWFAHLLPQGPWRRLLQATAGLDAQEDDDLHLLLSAGEDLPGAVTVAPADLSITGEPVFTSRDAVQPNGLAFSLAGAQAKLSVREGDSGLVAPIQGARGGRPGSFIAKFHDPRHKELPRLEFATTEWARRAGLDVHDARLVKSAAVFEPGSLPEGLDIGDGYVLLLTRFDRSPEGRIHMEDFGQLLGLPPGERQYSPSYETLAKVLALLAPADLREFVQRLVFMLASGNGDAHIKNWSVIYPDQRHPRLSPAYDLVATVTRIPKDDLALSLAGNRAFGAVDELAFTDLARETQADPSEMKAWIREARDEITRVWEEESSHLPFTTAERRSLEAHMGSVPLLRPATRP